MSILLFLVRFALASVFIASGVAKLFDRRGTHQALIGFHLPARLAAPVTFALPVAELAIAIALIRSASSWWGAVAALGLLLLITGGVVFNLAKGHRPLCHCFGQIAPTPISWRTLVRNALFAGIAGLVVLQRFSRTWPDVKSIIDTLARNVQIALFAGIGVTLAGVLLVEGWLIYRIRQRLWSLERKLATTGVALSPASSGSAKGLAPGVRAPDFRLKRLDGRVVALEHLRTSGKPVVLVFTDTECGPCTQLLPTLGYWQREHAAHLEIVNISRGPLEANRARSAVNNVTNLLVATSDDIVHAYHAFAVPSAVLVLSDGTIGSTLALGEGAIRALIEKVGGAGLK